MALPKNFKPKQGESRYTMTGLQSGETVKIRVLSDFIVGSMVWAGEGESRKPLRKPDGEPIPVGAIGVDKWGNPERVRQFIAAKVWNYDRGRVEVFETTKTTVIGFIFKYESDDEYGDSKGYDLKISKTGQGMDTEYSVIASPPKEFDKKLQKEADAEFVGLEALFKGDDPFAQSVVVDEEITSEKIADDVPF